MSNADFYKQEHLTVKHEVSNLKTNQFTFLTATIAATGILFGVGVAPIKKLPIDSNLLGIAFLFPLVVIIPFWHFYFDAIKVTARCVGYCRILENIITGNCYTLNAMGWENALHELRPKKKELIDQLMKEQNIYFPSNGTCFKIFLFKTEHPLWVLSYYTFFGLGLICLGISLQFLLNNPNTVGWIIFGLATIFFVTSGISNGINLIKLTYRGDTIECYEKLWEKVLCTEPSRRSGKVRRESHGPVYSGPERRLQADRRVSA